jgi:integrase
VQPKQNDDNRERVHGPYPHRNRWRIHLVAANGARRYRSFETEREAQEYLCAWREETDSKRLSEAVAEYLAHLRKIQRPATTVTTTDYRLRSLLRIEERDRSLRSLTTNVARQLFEKRTEETATETQVGELSCARTFAAWLMKRGWLRINPFVDLKPQGQRARGKPQLRIVEARRFLETALDERTDSGVAASMALLMGMRASEIVKRVVRDVDDGARVVWIDRAKTRAGDRQLEVPEMLRARLAALTAGREGGALLFGDVDRHWVGRNVRRLCKAAGVPIVCPHGLRGTYASIAARAVSVAQVADALGQVHGDVTRRHYLDAGAEDDGKQRSMLRVLTGGRETAQ